MIEILLFIAGLYTITLGTIHFFLPHLLDFDHAIPAEGPALKPFRLFGFSYDTTRTDVRGIAWVMNHSVSFAIVTIGIFDLIWPIWREQSYRPIACSWIALWWGIRAFTQFYLGKRRGDWFVVFWFLSLAGFHFYLAIQ